MKVRTALNFKKTFPFYFKIHKLTVHPLILIENRVKIKLSRTLVCVKKQQWREWQVASSYSRGRMRRQRKRLLHNSMRRRQVQRGRGMNDAPVPAAPPAPCSPRPRRGGLRVNVGPPRYIGDQGGTRNLHSSHFSKLNRFTENVLFELHYPFTPRFTHKLSWLTRSGRLSCHLLCLCYQCRDGC